MGKRKQPPGPDHLLARENFHGLNRQFYESRPQDYFDQRLTSLVLVAGGKGNELRQLAQGGIGVALSAYSG
jgi:hypothetical protein